jgi:hypothetical protein
MNAQFKFGALATDTVLKSITLPSANTTAQVRTVALDSAQMKKIFSGTPTKLTMTGAVTSAAPILVTPKQAVTITNRLILAVRLGGSN